jgi:tetratricopeptide (TPR) repeat protein
MRHAERDDEPYKPTNENQKDNYYHIMTNKLEGVSKNTILEGLVHLYQGHPFPPQAIKGYSDNIKRDNSDYWLRYLRGRILLNMKYFTEAKEDFDEVLKVDSNHPYNNYLSLMISLRGKEITKLTDNEKRMYKERLDEVKRKDISDSDYTHYHNSYDNLEAFRDHIEEALFIGDKEKNCVYKLIENWLGRKRPNSNSNELCNLEQLITMANNLGSDTQWQKGWKQALGLEESGMEGIEKSIRMKNLSHVK